VGDRARQTGVSKLVAVFSVGILIVIAGLTAVPASASTGIGVFVGYADSLRADATNFPTPWAGSPQTTFEGCLPVASCEYDGGGIRIVNNTGSTVTVNAIAVHIDSCTYTGWPSAVLSPGADLIVAQLASGVASGCSGPSPAHFDTSDVGPNGGSYTGICTPDGIQPTVDVTVNSQTMVYTDAGQVLNSGGVDGALCPPTTGNESTQWTTIGHAPCRGSLLSLTPAAQTHGVGTTATVTATFTNSCGQPLSNVAVQFAATAGPNAGRTGTGTTNANGTATFSYTSSVAGTDTLSVSVTNIAGSIRSNSVTVTWVLFAPGGGAFVISDFKDVTGHPVYWWGAQWWKNDHFITGLAPASFKGFEKSNLSPWCGQTWTTRPGNSPKPPRMVPGMMAVIVSSHITKKGSVISGDIVHIVMVRTDPGYGPNPGHKGTGTIVATLC